MSTEEEELTNSAEDSTEEDDDEEDDDEMPELHEACQEGDLDRVKHLLSNQLQTNAFDLNETMEGGYTALYIASCTNRKDIAVTLLEHKADPELAEEATGECALTASAQQGFADLVTCLLDHRAKVNAHNKANATALFSAALKGHAKVVEILIDAKANINTAKLDGATPAIICASKGHSDVLKLFIKAKADLSKKLNKGEWTALRMACGFKHDDCVKLLLQAGVEVDSKSTVYISKDASLQSVADHLTNSVTHEDNDNQSEEPEEQHNDHDEDDPFSPSSPTNRGGTGFGSMSNALGAQDDPFGATHDDADDDFWGDDGADGDFETHSLVYEDNSHQLSNDIDEDNPDQHSTEERNNDDGEYIFRSRGGSDFGLGSSDAISASSSNKASRITKEEQHTFTEEEGDNTFGMQDGELEDNDNEGEFEKATKGIRKTGRSESAMIMGVGAEDSIFGDADTNADFVIEEQPQ